MERQAMVMTIISPSALYDGGDCDGSFVDGENVSSGN